MNIRKAGRHELYNIAAFLNDCWRETYSQILSSEYLDNMSAEIRSSNFIKQFDEGTAEFLVMLDSNVLIGVAVYGKSITDGFDDHGEISAIYLSSDHIGKGYGHKLFEHAEQLLIDKGYKKFVLDVFIKNERAIQFYQKHGYEKVESRYIKLSDVDYPIAIMQKCLTS